MSAADTGAGIIDITKDKAKTKTNFLFIFICCIPFSFLKFHHKAAAKLMELVAKFLFENRISFISGAVAGTHILYAGFFDPLGEFANFCRRFVVEVKSSDYRMNLFVRKSPCNLVYDISRTTVGTAVKITRPLSVSNTRLCSCEKLSGCHPSALRWYMCSRLPIFSRFGVLCGMR